MSSTAWVYQRPEQVEKLGEDKASWYVGWYDPDGRRCSESCGPGFHGKKKAEKKRRHLEAELMTGTYQKDAKKLWADFRKEYKERVLAGLAVATRAQARISLDHFERIVKPIRMFALSTQHVDNFIATRRQERGLHKGDLLSPCSLNKDLRHLKAALRVADEWGYLSRLPKVRMEKVPKHLPTYITAEHFAALYAACDQAKKPADVPNVAPADWWRALIVMGYMTGWRVGDMLALRRDQLDLEAGLAVSLAEDNKGKRDELVKLHPVVVEHLRRLAGFTPTVLPWNQNQRTLYTEFARIQKAAGIQLPCPRAHEHTAFCHVYGFHDLRRAFATMNADKLTPDALQALMRHKSYQTTQVYINLARQMDAAVAGLHVPEVLRKPG
jgi:integrase